jgi:hypothetical protein
MTIFCAKTAQVTGKGAATDAFGTGGVVDTGIVNNYGTDGTIALQSDGKIVVAAADDAAWNFNVMRYETNGTLDPIYGSAGTPTGASSSAGGAVVPTTS